MKSILLAGCLGVALLNLAAASETGAPASSVEQVIAQAEKQCNDAYAANDLPKYFAFYADDAALIFYNQRTTVPAYRKMWTEATKTEPIESVELSDMVVRAPSHGIAIASYQITVRTHHPKGPSTVEKAFETDVWSHRSGAWKIIHVQYSAAPPKAP